MKVYGKNVECRNCSVKFENVTISKNYNFNYSIDKKRQMPTITGVPCPACGKHNLKRVKENN